MLILISVLASQAAQAMPMRISSYEKDLIWEDPPTIIICTEQTDYSREQVEEALEIWGAEYSEIIESSRCNYSHRGGTIKITDALGYNLGRAWAVTSESFDTKKDGKNYFFSAIIRMGDKCSSFKILVHEMGHALGYRHYVGVQDIMNPNIEC
jgi:hypothetical protein